MTGLQIPFNGQISNLRFYSRALTEAERKFNYDALSPRFQLQTLNEIGCFDDIPETANTFDGNSLQKAMYVWERFQIDCIADDSGLEVDTLNGEPGVFSARYAGEHGNHAKNIEKLLLTNMDLQRINIDMYQRRKINGLK
jgi:inosine/xanthosine triphosphate pyrophosphatase family protein